MDTDRRCMAVLHTSVLIVRLLSVPDYTFVYVYGAYILHFLRWQRPDPLWPVRMGRAGTLSSGGLR